VPSSRPACVVRTVDAVVAQRFKRKVMPEDIIKEVKSHSYYLKPGERRRMKQALAQKRARKKLRKERD
jgi:small subunit ribosomal protein S21